MTTKKETLSAAARDFAAKAEMAEARRKARLAIVEELQTANFNATVAAGKLDDLRFSVISLEDRSRLVEGALSHYQNMDNSTLLEVYLAKEALDRAAATSEGDWGSMEKAAIAYGSARRARDEFFFCFQGIDPSMRAKWQRAKAESARVRPLLAKARAAFQAQQDLVSKLDIEVVRLKEEERAIVQSSWESQPVEVSQKVLQKEALAYAYIVHERVSK